jgi:hypothetical protein
MATQEEGGDAAFSTVLSALTRQATNSFEGVVADIEQHVLPAMSWIAKGLVVIAARLKSGIYTDQIASAEVDGLVDAAASVLVRFANRVLQEVQDTINAVLAACRAAINAALGVALV